MKDQRSKTVIVLAILLVLTISYIGYGFYSGYHNTELGDAYQQGFLDAQTVVNRNIINSLNTQGYVAFTAPTGGNETTTIKLGIIPE